MMTYLIVIVQKNNLIVVVLIIVVVVIVPAVVDVVGDDADGIDGRDEERHEGESVEAATAVQVVLNYHIILFHSLSHFVTLKDGFFK
jgi:hypothetical protein